jgi:hypothetical protein
MREEREQRVREQQRAGTFLSPLPRSRADAVLALQQTAGNQAVGPALAAGRTPPRFERARGPATSGASELGPMFVVMEAGPDGLGGFPAILGVAQETCEKVPYPSLAPVAAEGGCSFGKVALGAVPEGRADVLKRGKSTTVSDVAVDYATSDTTLSAGKFNFRNVCSTIAESVQRQSAVIAIELTDELYDELVLREQDHLDDSKYAHKISVGAVAQALDALAGQRFESAAMALAALAEQVPKQLVPTNAHDPKAWAERLTAVYTELCGQSKRRDRLTDHGTGEHRPKGWNVRLEEPSTLVVSPVFNPLRTATKDLIRLDDVAPAPTPEEIKFGVGSPVRLKSDVSATIFAGRTLRTGGASWEGFTVLLREGCQPKAIRRTKTGMCVEITQTSGAGADWEEHLERCDAQEIKAVYADIPLKDLELALWVD